MNESIVWLYQQEARNVTIAGVRAAELAKADPQPIGFVIIAAAVDMTRRGGRLPLDMRDEILHAYHRLIIFGGNYLPFVKLSASPVHAEDNMPAPIITQLGGKAVVAKVEEMINQAEAGVSFAILVQQREPVLRLRPYLLIDRDDCLSIFRGNLPIYFAPQEEKDFAAFLGAPNCPYFVTERGGEIVGCGGYWLDEENQKAGMVWGMVRSERQQSGIGTFMLLSRLQAIAIQCTNCAVQLNTSQHTYPFFEKFGFEVQKITENYFGEGLHCYAMTLYMNEERRRWIAQNLGKFSE